ncbi:MULTISPECIES: type-F conjugative transfer system pilin assembly protein TrbC [Enterobacteriaceae]|uniref:Type-F conjugative transfer system pilin assembly protein TrbC n=1 Tax=Enterobacter cloacae TaxID=550 RepID=A0AA42U5R3_ENTCL|nr:MULTISPECIES: type-F conjugative transfer system pilin assembly protein TrbC [Enterobacteriaceae]KYC19130.1 conjugal transfer protein TrbC [Citrobacter sp. AATXR]MDH0441725.1 type-F conjugative transfer system pilin assembly protein TrbC [Enterobacter cloacae]MDH1480276.1 type-F conjugative transfer system pilin assembly protein TrbC [Enterobacter cloacae]UXL13094.1 type-F conjugative transfer system pilin assembly protein TrbC [Enterobacter cloacae]HAT3667079.1 type-F conjugative transfer 
MKIAYLRALTISVMIAFAPLARASTQTDISVSDHNWIKGQQDALAAMKEDLQGQSSTDLSLLPQRQQDLINRLQGNIAAQSTSMGEKDTFPAIYFVSLGIPREGLLPMLKDARRYNIPPTLRGLVNNDMRQTAAAMFELSKEDKDAGVQIDPTLFTQYNITTVPALVVTCPGHHDVIRGSLPLQQALEKVAESGDCAATARHLLEAAR